MVASTGGPRPIEHRLLNVDTLADAIEFCFSLDIARSTESIASRVKAEDGVKTAVSFHRNLPTTGMSCDLVTQQSAS